MGGDVEGIVAIVQGLPDAGLAVTVMGRKHEMQSNVSATPQRLLDAKSMIETSAWPAAANAAVQICDDWYTSTYQLAHCNARPTSPPVNLSEFPRQRAELCRTQGNFEVAALDNPGTSSPIKIDLHQRNGFISPDRGSLTTTQSSRGTEAFVSSLRKYPSISPDDSFSSDLVLRLIAYTQAKNFSKGSYHSKSIRNLRNKKFMEQTKGPEVAKSKSKSVQTYTRAEPEAKEDENLRKVSRPSARRYRSVSPVHEQSSRYKKRQSNESYDYLRSPSPRHFNDRAINVRYLNDFTRCLRDTMRQLYDDTPQVCPNYQSRYNRHRRLHHSDLHMSSHNMEAQASVPLVSTGVPALSRCQPMPGTYIQTCPLNSKRCCYCHKPLPCNCKRRSSAIQDKDEIFKRKLEEQVCAWLQEIPVFVNDTPEDQVVRENMVKDLIDKLKSLKRDEYYEENAYNEILECVGNLPMWYPGDKGDQDLFKTQIIDNLMNKIRGMSSESVNHKDEISKWIDDISFKSRDSKGQIVDERSIKEDLVNRLNILSSNPPKNQTVKSEIVEMLNESPIKVVGDKATYIKDLAETLANKLQTLPTKGKRDSTILTKQVLEWLENAPKLQGSRLENQKTAAELGNILKQSLNQGKDASAIKDDISNWLANTLKSKGERLDSKQKNELVEKLFDKVNTAPSNERRDSTLLTKQVLEWLEDVPELQGSRLENQKTAAELGNILKQSLNQGKYASAVKDDISNWLANTLKSKGERLNSKQKNDLVEKLFDKVNTAPSNKKRDSTLLTKQVLDWLEDVPELQGSRLENQKTAAKLGNILKQTLNQGKDASAVKDDISNWLANTLKSNGERLNSKQKNDLVEKLFDKVNTGPSNERRDSTLLTKQVLEWLEDVPELQGSRLENQKTAAKLGNILKQTLNQGKDASAVKDDIFNWLANTLKSKGERLNFKQKNDLVEKLFDKVNTAPLNERRDSTLLTKQVLDWLEDVPELQGSRLENQKTAAELGNILKQSLNQGKDASAVKDDISNWLANTLKNKGERLNSKQKSDLVEKLFDKVNTAPLNERRDSTSLTKQVLDWLEDVPELQGSRLENQKTAAELGNILKQSLKQGKDTSAVKDDISDWLANTLKSKGERLNSKQKNDLVEKLFDKVNTTPDKTNVNNEIFEMLNDIPNLDISAGERKELVQELAEKMQELQSYDGDDTEAVKNEIIDWVNKLSENSGVIINSKDKENLTTKLMALIPGTSNRRKRWSKQEDLVLSAINYQLSDIFDNTSVDIDEADKKEIQDKISALIYKNIDKIKSDDNKKITSDIFNILEEDARIPARKAKQITDEILKKVETMKLSRRRSSELKDVDFLKSLNEEVSNVISNSKIENKDEVEAILSNILADQAMRGESDKQTKDRLLSILKNSNLSNEESEKIATKIMGNGKELLLSHRSQKGATRMFNESSRSLQTLPPMHKQMYVDNAQKEILYFTEDLTNDSGVLSAKKWRDAAYELAENVGNIVSNPNTSSLAKKDLMKDVIVKYLENNDTQSGSNPEAQAIKLVGRLKNLVFTTSTPRTSDVDKSFYPSISTIGFDSTFSQYQRQQIPTKDEVQYTSQLVDKIENWMKNLPMDMDLAENKGFKEKMITDLAGGIIDRQKYLQLNPNAKTSDEEELEHLKYQVFRWLNKLPDGKQLMPSLAKTYELMDSIQAVPVPLLTKENTFRGSFTSQVPDLSLIEAEISKWMKAVPSDQYTTTDKNRQKLMIKELAENIQNNQKNNTLTEPVLDDMIIVWLEEMVNDSKQSLLNLSESLKATLINKMIISFFQDIQLKREQSRMFIEDIRSHILGWLKDKQLYQRRNSTEKREQEQIFSQLSKALKDASVAETNNLKKDTKLFEEIKSHIQRLPKDSHLANDNKFLHDTAKELLAYYKESKIFKEITAASQISQSTSIEPGFKKAADILYDNIENWCNNLPISGGNAPEEREKIKTLKQNIVSKLINKVGDLNMNPEIFNDDTLYEDILNDEIDDLLSSLPQTAKLKYNIAALKDSLIEKIKEAKQKTQSELASHVYKQQLRDAISTTLPSVQNLTMDEQVPFEILKDNLADAYINLHYSTDNKELQNKLKQKILDELNLFCNDYLKRFPASPVNAMKLNQQMYTALQKVPTPKDETIKAQVEQVRIKDAIYDWLKNITVKDNSPAQQMQKNKIVSVLAKLLHETEQEKNANLDIDVDDKMRKDITKWTNKLPLKPGAESNIVKEVDKLIDSLKSTEKSRRFSISNLKPTANRSKTQYPCVIPPSCLCLEDRAHLEQIRQRAQRPSQHSTEMSQSKNVYVNPIPVDEGSQTEIGLQNRQPLSPNVVVNEYEWDSTDALRIQESYSDVETNPNMLGRSYPMMPQQMPPQYLQSQQQSMSWPQPRGQRNQRTSATPQSQYGSGPQTPYTMPPPCPLQPPCTMSRRLCMASPHFTSPSGPCAPSPPPCSPPLPTCAPPPPPCALPTRPYAGSELPSVHPTSSYAPPQSTYARQTLPSASPLAPCYPPQQPCISPQPPCTHPTLPCPTPQLRCYPPPQPCTPPPSMFQPPCMSSTPSMHHMRSYPSQVPKSLSLEVSYGPQRRCVPRQLQSENSRDFSSTSSPFDEYPDGVMSRSFRQSPRVTRLGSFDDVPFTRNCGSQSPRAKPSRGSPHEEFKWSIQLPDDYWDTTCTKRPCRIPRNVGRTFIKERKEETVRCRCSRNPRDNHSPCRRTNSMQHCSKCCGQYCPHPSYMFFR